MKYTITLCSPARKSNVYAGLELLEDEFPDTFLRGAWTVEEHPESEVPVKHRKQKRKSHFSANRFKRKQCRVKNRVRFNVCLSKTTHDGAICRAVNRAMTVDDTFSYAEVFRALKIELGGNTFTGELSTMFTSGLFEEA